MPYNQAKGSLGKQVLDSSPKKKTKLDPPSNPDFDASVAYNFTMNKKLERRKE